MSAKDQESGKTAGNNSRQLATGALPINWGLRSGAGDTVGCLANNHSPSFSANRTVSVVCAQCREAMTGLSHSQQSPSPKPEGQCSGQ